MSTVVIVGGFGAVGTHICQLFLERGYTVVAYDLRRRRVPFLEPFGPRLVTEIGDVHDLKRLQAAVEGSGAEGIVDATDQMRFDDPHGTVRDVAQGIGNILEVARLQGICAVSCLSAAIYGMVPDPEILITEEMAGQFPIGPVREEDSLWAPMHAATKRMKLAALEMYRTMYAVDAVAVCFSGQISQADTRPVPLYDYIRAALEGKPYAFPAGGDRPVDNMYAKDTALGVYLALTAPRPLRHGFYNIGWERAYTLREMADTVQKLVPDSQIHVGPGLIRNYPTKSYWRGAIATARAQAELGYRPQYNLESTVRELLDWFRQRPELLPPPHTTAERVPQYVVGYEKKGFAQSS